MGYCCIIPVTTIIGRNSGLRIRNRTNNILYITEADWAGNKDHVISHVLRIEEFQVFYLNRSFYNFAFEGGKDHKVDLKRAEKIILLLQSGIFDVIAGDCIDVMILKHHCRELGLDDPPAVMTTLEPRLERYVEIGEIVRAKSKRNPAHGIATAGNVLWLCPSKEFRPVLEDRGIRKERIFYFPSTTFVQNLMNPETDAAFRKSKTSKVQNKTAEGKIISAGVFNRDFSTFIKAMAGINRQALIITDTGRLTGSLPLKKRKALISDIENSKNVELKSAIPLPDYINTIKSASLVVVPLETDYFNSGQLTIADAQRAGTPVIAADFATARDFVKHGSTGLLYEPGNHADLKSKIQTILSDPGTAGEITLKARRHERKLSRECRRNLLAAFRSLYN